MERTSSGSSAPRTRARVARQVSRSADAVPAAPQMASAGGLEPLSPEDASGIGSASTGSASEVAAPPGAVLEVAGVEVELRPHPRALTA